MSRVALMAVCAMAWCSAACAQERGYVAQWHPSEKTMLDYVSDGYSIAHMYTEKQVYGENRHFYLQGRGAAAHCWEIYVTTVGDALASTAVGCSDLTAPTPVR